MTEISFQLYSARNTSPLSGVLSNLAALGFSQVEGYGGLYRNLPELSDALSATGLKMPTGHFDLDALETDVDNCIATAHALGIQTIFCPYIPPDHRPTEEKGWQEFGARLQKISIPYRAAGLGFGWHNHDYEFAALSDGTFPIDHMFAGGPELEWEIDVAWIVRAGLDPLAYVDKYANRITAVHIKDLAPAGENADEDGWADVGYGVIDWKRILIALHATKARHFVVEHDNPSDLDRFASRSIATIMS